MHIFHKWPLWSKPKNHEFHITKRFSFDDEVVDGMIQDRTCAKCGKYQWRKV